MVEVDVSPLSIRSHHLFLYLALNPPSSSSNQEDNLALIYIDRYNAHYYFLPTNQELILRIYADISFMRLPVLKPSRDCTPLHTPTSC